MYYYPPHLNASSDGDPGPGVGNKWEEIIVSMDQLLLTATDKSRHLTFFLMSCVRPVNCHEKAWLISYCNLYQNFSNDWPGGTLGFNSPAVSITICSPLMKNSYFLLKFVGCLSLWVKYVNREPLIHTVLALHPELEKWLITTIKILILQIPTFRV